ncbi:hypothetical protein Q4R79_18365, partial [Morganella morganii]
MAKNEFLPFGTAEGANVLSNQEYEALAARHNGFTSGVAKSKELNKVWRQASLIASAVAQFIVDTDQKDLLDTGDFSDIKARLSSAINLIISNGDYVTNPYLKLELLKKIDKADITQQLGNDTGKVVSQNLLATELGKKASVADANSKLAKDQNGADIPNKDTFIKNLGLGEIYATREDVGEKLDKSKVTNSLINSMELVPTTALMIDNLALKQPVGDYQPKGEYALLSDLKSLIKPGFTMQTILDEADIAPPWYLINGDRYGLDTPQGKVLRAFSADLKARWNITQTAETITLPKTLQSDGRMPFPRPVNGTGRKTGSVSGDTIRNFTGELGYEANYGLTTGERDVSGVFRAYGASKGSFTGGGGGRSLNIMFD